MATGLVSVVMPSHNSEAFLGDAVESVLGQTYRPIELLIVDDGSTDGSAGLMEGLARHYPEQVRCLRQRNRGPYPARNLGLGRARGEFIAFLDADDYWHPALVAKLAARIRQGQLDLAYCGWQNVGVEGGFGDPYVPPAYEDGDAVGRFLEDCPWPIHAALMRRSLLAELGGFSERCFTSMDFDLWLRSLALAPSMARVAEVLAYYRWHDRGQISAVKSRQVSDAWRVRRDFVARHPDLIRHLDTAAVRERVDGFLIRNAQRAYWQRDLPTAQRLFRLALRKGAFRSGHLRHLLPSLLPMRLYSALVTLADRRGPQGS
jgi:glycosyltransferase involved in cell wall biosynthesis